MFSTPSDVIASLYDVFGGYPTPKVLPCSPSKSASDQRSYQKLVTEPLRTVSPKILGPYATSAPYTVGSEADYKHFLPRILETALSEGGWGGFEAWAIASKLVYLNWRDWPEQEVDILRCYFALAFEQACTRPLSFESDLEEWLVASLLLGETAEAQLAIALRTHGSQAIMHMAVSLVAGSDELIRKGDFGSGIWEKVAPSERDEIVRFLGSEEFQDALVKHGVNASADDVAYILEPALDFSEQLQQTLEDNAR
ncbi:MAG: hypothetical protein AAF697_05140 [Pseudomonadota bacterium]